MNLASYRALTTFVIREYTHPLRNTWRYTEETLTNEPGSFILREPTHSAEPQAFRPAALELLYGFRCRDKADK